jgi:hypothetical protein
MNDVAHPNDYERTDANPRLIGALAGGVALFVMVTPLLLGVCFPGSERMGGVPKGLPLPPAPRLQTHPKYDLDRLRGAEHRQLTTYGWVNRDNGLVHIPVKRAMQLIAERGLQGWSASPVPPPQPAR